jgi:hypothetical protein
MAYKSPLNLKTWLPQPDQRPVIERDQEAEMGPFPSVAREIASLPVLDDHLPALREVLGSDSYQVALVPRDECAPIPRPQVEPFSTASQAVLLPFSWMELVVRVCEFVRDSPAPAARSVARFEDVCVDFTKMEVSRSSGDPIILTAQEFKTLKCFLSNPDRVFSRDELLSEAWGYELSFNPHRRQPRLETTPET